jgi:uncharacterized protein YbcI
VTRRGDDTPAHFENAAGAQTGYSLASRISTEMVRFMSRYTGRGPTRARTTLNTNVAAVVLEDTLTKAETNLVAAGEIEAVCQQRRTFHHLMRDEVIATIEELTGRRVRAYLSDISPEAGIAAHTFVFEPRPDTGEAYVAERSDDG